MYYITVCILTAIAAYLIGSISSSIIISKIKGDDIRSHGSGNAGATNMLRTYGKGFGILTLVLDALKGIIAVGLAKLTAGIIGLEDASLIMCISALGVVLGHNYPIFFKFKGGKGISTSAACIFMLDWRIGLIVLIGAVAVMAIMRYVSLGSVVGAVLFPTSVFVFTFFIDKTYNLMLMFTSLFMGLLAIYRHKANIIRLINGTEAKLGQKK